MGPLQAQVPAPASSAAEIQAQQELDEAARAYRQGNFAEAQSHSEKALLIDPQNTKAPYFVARTIHAQYKLGDATPENIAKAQEAISAYKKILDRWPGDDEAYKAVAYLYGALKEEALLERAKPHEVFFLSEKAVKRNSLRLALFIPMFGGQTTDHRYPGAHAGPSHRSVAASAEEP